MICTVDDGIEKNMYRLQIVKVIRSVKENYGLKTCVLLLSFDETQRALIMTGSCILVKREFTHCYWSFCAKVTNSNNA